MKTNQYNIRYIVVHSIKALPAEKYIVIPYHYIIWHNGTIDKGRELLATDACVQIALLSDANCERMELQNDILFKQLVLLAEIFPEAKIVGANEVFGEASHPGLNVTEWIKNYTPKILVQAA